VRIIAARGWPVLPDVYIKWAGSSASEPLARPRSPASPSRQQLSTSAKITRTCFQRGSIPSIKSVTPGNETPGVAMDDVKTLETLREHSAGHHLTNHRNIAQEQLRGK